MRSRSSSSSSQPFEIYQDNELEDISEDEEDDVTVDPIRKLAHFFPAVSNILSFLDPIDLARASCVSHDWNETVQFDPRSRRRKEAYVKDFRELRSSVGEENWPLKEPESVKPLVREAFRDLRFHQQPVRAPVCDTPKQQDDDVFCKSAAKRSTAKLQPLIHRHANIQSVDRMGIRVNHQASAISHPQSFQDFKTPHLKSNRILICNSGSDAGSLFKENPRPPNSQQQQRSLSGFKSISRRLLDDEPPDSLAQSRRTPLAGSWSSKKNLRRL
jgi:hypothetical protein